MKWTRKKIGAAVLAAAALTGGAAAVTGMYYGGSPAGTHATAMHYEGSGMYYK